MKNYNSQSAKLTNALVYFIIITTVVMLAPLVYKLAGEYSDNIWAASSGDREAVNERAARNKQFTVAERTVDISGLRNTEFGALSLISAKITDGGDIILFCSGRAEAAAAGTATATTPTPTAEPEEIMRIAALTNTAHAADEESGVLYGELAVSARAFRNHWPDSLRNKDYIFKDYGDGTFFMSNSRTAFLFDTPSMRAAENYSYPYNFNVYHSALSNDKEKLAIAAEEGFFIGNPKESSMPLGASNMKELIAAVNAGGVIMTARNPVWSSDDERIFYKLYADNFVRYAGVTAASPGGNERLTALDASNFIFLKDDTVFYYISSDAAASPVNLFRCGYFNLNERRMQDVMKSQVFYFDVDVSSGGAHFAALSHNGNMIKISVIDILTKKLIYSSLYSEIYDFSFSPDEKNIIIYGRADNRRTLRVINIDWTEE